MTAKVRVPTEKIAPEVAATGWLLPESAAAANFALAEESDVQRVLSAAVRAPMATDMVEAAGLDPKSQPKREMKTEPVATRFDAPACTRPTPSTVTRS